MNKKNIKVYKSCLLAGFALVSLSLATGVKADQVESNSLSVSISTSNLNSVSAQSSVSSNVSAASSSAAPASENTAVSANENTNEDHSASSVTNSQQGAGVISTSAVPDSTANTNSGVASASETNLGDVDNAAVDVAKSAAVVSYEATGQVQKVTRSSAVSTTEVVSNGWSANTTGTKYFYKDGQKANGYLYDGSNWYLFKDGLRQSDVQQWAGTYYYFDHNTYLRVDNSYVKSSWGDWYLFGNDGRITTNVQQWAGTYYYFDPSTYLKVTNAYKKSSWGDWYMFGNDGRIVTGLCYWQGSYYYFDSTSFLKKTNTSVNGDTFNADGAMIDGIVKNSNSTYFVDQHNGQTETYTSYVTGDDLAAKEWIASHESGGSYTARNGVCYGRYQLNVNYYLNGNYSVVNQEKAADAYVTSRYGSWLNAKTFWLAHNWY